MHGPTAVPHVPCYPKPIMHWTEGVFGKCLKRYDENFVLRENGKQIENCSFLFAPVLITFSQSKHVNFFSHEYN